MTAARGCGLRTMINCLDSAANAHEEELSEEDQQLKNELEMLVERLKVRQSASNTR